MVDYTEIKLNKVPPPLENLQRENNGLKMQNKVIKTILYVTITFIAAYGVYKIYKTVMDNRNQVTQKLNRKVSANF